MTKDWRNGPFERTEYDAKVRDHVLRMEFIDRTLGMFYSSVMMGGGKYIYFHRPWTDDAEAAFKVWIEQNYPLETPKSGGLTLPSSQSYDGGRGRSRRRAVAAPAEVASWPRKEELHMNLGTVTATLSKKRIEVGDGEEKKAHSVWDFDVQPYSPENPRGVYRHLYQPDSGKTLCGRTPRFDENWLLDEQEGLEVHCSRCLAALARKEADAKKAAEKAATAAAAEGDKPRRTRKAKAKEAAATT